MVKVAPKMNFFGTRDEKKRHFFGNSLFYYFNSLLEAHENRDLCIN
jgi:hypothetical protein